ncbi:MAG: glycosyltransferase, partial [Microvirga sp.]
DLVHTWDWPQCLDAFFGLFLHNRTPLLATSMSMVVDRILPKSIPTTFGTPELLKKAVLSGRRRSHLLLPPVDVGHNSFDPEGAKLFRMTYGIMDGELLLVTVSRLVSWMKSESIRRTIQAVRILGKDMPISFAIVGSGDSFAELERLAVETNAHLGRSAVVMTGALLDPRPAYSAADIVVGMGSSALRGMAIGKPVVVVGERGFSAPFGGDTAELFYYQGMYGLGDGEHSADRLASDVRMLAASADQLPALGDFGRQFVLQHFSLGAISENLNRYCSLAVNAPPRTPELVLDGIRTAAVLAAHRVRRGGPSRVVALKGEKGMRATS